MRSMTGFGQTEGVSCGLSIEVVLKSVNHKSLDWSFRMPRRFFAMENVLRGILQEEISRGRVEVNVQIRGVDASLSNLTVDLARADAVKEALDLLRDRYGVQEDPTLSLWMQTPDLFVETPSELDESQLKADLEAITRSALSDFLGMREREGQSIKAQFEQNLAEIERKLVSLEESIPSINEEHAKKIRAKIDEILVSDPEFAESRLKQELLFYLEKSDIREEMTRLAAHLKEFRDQIETSGPIGKRLDFICQEMNREANTIASKSQHLLQTKAAVDMKVQIEQIREQILNVE